MPEHFMFDLGLLVAGVLVGWAGWSAIRVQRVTESLIPALGGARADIEKPKFLRKFEAAAKQFATLPGITLD
jgi:hypothetical protein